MRVFLVVALFSLAGVSFSASPAQAAKMPGDTCEPLGATTMADDQINLVACLKRSPNDAALVWKLMSFSPKQLGVIMESSQVNFGSDWNYIELKGSYVSTDAGAAGGFISKALNQAALHSATSRVSVFSLTSSYQCSLIGAGPGNDQAQLCAKVVNGNLFISTDAKIRLVYAVF